MILPSSRFMVVVIRASLTLYALAVRHEPLRSRLQIAQDGYPFQIMEKEPQINIEYTDLRIVNSPREDIRGLYISYLQSANDIEFSFPNSHLAPMALSSGRNTHEDIVFNFWEKLSEGKLCLDIQWLWRMDLFDKKTIRKASSMLEILFDVIARDININVQSFYDSLAGLN